MVTKPLYLYLVLLFAFRCFCYFCSRRGKVASELGRNYRLDGREYWTNNLHATKIQKMSCLLLLLL